MSLSVPPYVTTAVTTVGAIGGAYYAYKLYQEKKNKLPTEWRQVGHLKNIFIYPIKSCARIELNQAKISLLGLKDGWNRDRVFMVVDTENRFITARNYPELLKIQPTFHRAIMTLQHPDLEPIQINLAEVQLTQKPKKSMIWNDMIDVCDCGDEAQKWLTKLLNRPNMNFRLVYYTSDKPSLAAVSKVAKVFNKYKIMDSGALPDETSFNIINESSVIDLNKRLKTTQVSEKNFRPNFLFTGCEAYDEDNWNFIKIGENVFEVVKPCTRCVLTTIDPETGVRDPNSEPLETLRSYRLSDDPLVRKATGISPAMGIQVALRSGPGGVVSLNEPVYVA